MILDADKKTKPSGPARLGAMLVFFLLAGCSIQPYRTVVVEGHRLHQRVDIPHIRHQTAIYEEISTGNWNNGGRITENLPNNTACRVKYHPSYRRKRWIVVEGTLGNGRNYPVVLDTGASPLLSINDIHIAENKLAIHPLGERTANAPSWGISLIPKLQISDITLLNWPCFYREQHTETQVFGLAVGRGKAIIAGVPALRRFSYVAFDNTKEEVELSLKNQFACDNPDLWSQYPFVIEEDLGGNAYLFVDIHVAGKQTRLQLDTGSAMGLLLAEKLWEEIHQGVHRIKLKKAKDLYPYIGWLDCKKGVIRNLNVGGSIVRNAQISIFPDDSPLLEHCKGLLGMRYFRDSVVVLDFERSIMWVKKASSR